MSVTRLRPGMEIDVITREEVKSLVSYNMRAQFQAFDQARKTEYPLIKAQVQADGTGNVAASVKIGPADGYVWDIRRLIILGGQANATVAPYLNSSQPGDIADDIRTMTATGTAVYKYDNEQLVLVGGMQLWIVGSGFTNNAILTISGQAKEVAMSRLESLGN